MSSSLILQNWLVFQIMLACLYVFLSLSWTQLSFCATKLHTLNDLCNPDYNANIANSPCATSVDCLQRSARIAPQHRNGWWDATNSWEHLFRQYVVLMFDFGCSQEHHCEGTTPTVMLLRTTDSLSEHLRFSSPKFRFNLNGLTRFEKVERWNIMFVIKYIECSAPWHIITRPY